MTRVQRLLADLEACWVEPGPDVPLEALSAMMEERAPVLDAIVRLSATRLEAEERAELRAALLRVQARDEAWRTRLSAAFDEASAHLRRVAEGRGAVRGYKNQASGAGIVLVKA